MSAQLTLLDAALAHADMGGDHQWLPGEDIRSDIAAVLAYIPNVGHRHNTVREKSMRPLAYLYARTALLEPDERRIVQGIARVSTGFEDEWNGHQRDGALLRDNGTGEETARGYEVWVRLSGGHAIAGREPTRSVTSKDRGFPWGVAFLSSYAATPKVRAWREQVRPHLRAMGCDPGKRQALTLPSLAPLILALRWSDHVAAAVFLAGSGVAPKSGDWAMHVDLAMSRGLPWSVPLAELSARHPRDVLSRAIAWVHAQGMYRRVVR